jgi:uncharacterized protein
MAEPILTTLKISLEQRTSVLHAARWHNSKRADSLLLRILRDADMLDGLGAIGIMRAYMSQSMLPDYLSDISFERETPIWPPPSASDQVLNQLRFYDWLNTDTARKMAAERFSFMQTFVNQLRREITGDDR